MILDDADAGGEELFHGEDVAVGQEGVFVGLGVGVADVLFAPGELLEAVDDVGPFDFFVEGLDVGRVVAETEAGGAGFAGFEVAKGLDAVGDAAECAGG
ncbi:MAG: hypothetical protein WCO56_26775 [Verrucomicrobiota bacterium]